MGTDEDRTAIADLKARMNALEKDVIEIKTEQRIARNRDEQAALREKDLSAQMASLSKDIEAHIAMHKENGQRKDKTFEIIMAVGMLLTAAISAYGAIK